MHIHFLDVTYDFRLNNIDFFEKLRTLNRKTGFLVPCYNIEEYAKTMEIIVNNPKIIKKTSNQLSSSIEKFSFKTIISQWHKAFNEK